MDTITQLALDEDQLLLAAGLLLAWGRGFVEPVALPPEPRHIVAQQLLALCLQERRVGERLWQEWLPLPALLGDCAEAVASHLLSAGFVEREDGMLFIGPEAERRFGMRHFMGLMAVFTAPPEFTVRLRPDLRASAWPSVVESLTGRLVLPSVDEKALDGLKFSEALPRHLAEATLAARLADLEHAGQVLGEQVPLRAVSCTASAAV